MKRIFSLLSVAIVGLTPFGVWADEGIDLNPGSDRLFNERNMIPGDSVKEDIEVENELDSEVDIYFKIDDVTDNDFAKVLQFYLIDDSSNKYFIGGSGDRFTLREMEKEGRVFVERMDAYDSNDYELKIKFNQDAGNEFQGRETRFDFAYSLEMEEVITGSPIPYRSGQVPGGNDAPEDEPEEVQEDPRDIPESTPSETKVDTGGFVQGVTESVCSSWPLWKWIVLLVLFTLVFNFKKLSGLQSVQRVGMLIQLLALVIALVLWWLYDGCRIYLWVPVAIIVIAIITSLIWRKGKKVTVHDTTAQDTPRGPGSISDKLNQPTPKQYSKHVNLSYEKKAPTHHIGYKPENIYKQPFLQDKKI